MWVHSYNYCSVNFQVLHLNIRETYSNFTLHEISRFIYRQTIRNVGITISVSFQLEPA